jgi:hypothetical protein
MSKHDADRDGTAVASRASDVIDGAAELARSLPDQLDRAAGTTGRVVEDAQRTLQGGSHETLLAGASMAAGVAVGLLVGRAPRLLVVLGLLPAVAMGLTLAQRRGGMRLEADRTLVN